MRKAMNTAGGSPPAAEAPSARRAPTEKRSTMTMPANTSLSGLISVDAPCARSTRLRYWSASRRNRSISNASAT